MVTMIQCTQFRGVYDTLWETDAPEKSSFTEEKIALVLGENAQKLLQLD